MSLPEVVILGLVQGLAEFLPVSSSGHLLAARLLLGWTDTEGTAFDAFLHLGTLVAVLTFYWRVWWGIGRGLLVPDLEGRDKRELLAKITVATVPGAVLGYFWQEGVGEMVRTRGWLAASFLVTAGVLWWFDWYDRRESTVRRADWRDALFIGLAQAIALVPGISRSGMTIAAARWRGLSRRQAVNFSFLLSAPIIAGASLSSWASLLANGSVPGGQLLLGFLVSLISGLLAIYLLLKVVERMSFMPFVVYLVGLAAVILFFVK